MNTDVRCFLQDRCSWIPAFAGMTLKERGVSRRRSASVMIRIFLLATALLGAGCGAIPSDPDGTLERVRAERQFKVGLIASHAPPPAGAADLLKRLSRATGATAALERGPAEALLTKLEEGDLDLVLGEFAEKSPWAAKVTLSEPIVVKGATILAAAARNGENAWIALVHREARAAARR
jgi:ABC-type amino acid transport substrate-binding protein